MLSMHTIYGVLGTLYFLQCSTPTGARQVPPCGSTASPGFYQSGHVPTHGLPWGVARAFANAPRPTVCRLHFEWPGFRVDCHHKLLLAKYNMPSVLRIEVDTVAGTLSLPSNKIAPVRQEIDN